MDIDLTERITLDVQDQKYCRPVWAILWLDSEDVIEEPLELNNFAEQQVTVVCPDDLFSLASLTPLPDNGPVLLVEGVASPVQFAVKVACGMEDCNIPPLDLGDNFFFQVELVDESLSTVSNLTTIDGSWTDGIIHPANTLERGFSGLGSTVDMIMSTELTVEVGDCSSVDHLRITVQPSPSLGLVDNSMSNNFLLMPVNCQLDSEEPDSIVTDFSFMGRVDYTEDKTSFIPYTLQKCDDVRSVQSKVAFVTITVQRELMGLDDHVKNAGPEEIPAYMLDWDIYLSENPVIDHETDMRLDYAKTSMQMDVIQEEIMPEATVDVSDLGKGFILPSIRCGRWYVGVIAGDTKPEEEKLWSNNIKVQPIDISCPNDVYSISAANFQQSTFYIWKGAPANVTFDLTVTNVGPSNVLASVEQTNFDIGVALSSDEKLDSQDYILDTSIQFSGGERLLQYATHQQGESFVFHSLSAEITIPEAYCDAARFLVVVVVSESDSILVNNHAALQLRPSCSGASADIQADAISVTGPLTPNVAVDFTLLGKVLVNLGAAVTVEVVTPNDSVNDWPGVSPLDIHVWRETRSPQVNPISLHIPRLACVSELPRQSAAYQETHFSIQLQVQEGLALCEKSKYKGNTGETLWTEEGAEPCKAEGQQAPALSLGLVMEPFNYKLWLSLDEELDPLEDFDLKYPLPHGRPFPSALTETENRLDLSGRTRTGS
ncbi:hypothetical protein Bbelb_398730, partial [Branchiostoma belcheri]